MGDGYGVQCSESSPHGCQPCSSCMPLWHCIILALVLFVISRLSLTTYMHNCIKFIVTTKHILYFQFLLLHPLLVCLTNTFIILLIICKKHCFWYTLNEQKRMQILFCLFRIALECSTPQNQGPYRRVHHILGSSYLSPDDLDSHWTHDQNPESYSEPLGQKDWRGSIYVFIHDISICNWPSDSVADSLLDAWMSCHF